MGAELRCIGIGREGWACEAPWCCWLLGPPRLRGRRSLCVLRSATVMFCEEALFSHFFPLSPVVVLRNVVLGSLCLLNLQPPERGLGLLGLVRPLNILTGNDRRYSGASIHNPTRPTVTSREHRKDSKVLRSASLCCAPLMHWHADQSGRTFLQIKRPCLTYLSLVARNQRAHPQ